MQYNEVKTIVREILWEWEQEHFDGKDCPKCRASCTMVRVSVMPLEGDREGFTNKWRCLNCLGVFTEELKSIE